LIFAIQQRVDVLPYLEHREPQRTIHLQRGWREPHERWVGVRGQHYDGRVEVGEHLPAVDVALGATARRRRILFYVLV